MAAVLFINDTLPAFGERAWLSRWPIVGLTATVIAFSNDPLVGVLAIVVAAPLAGFLNGQSLGEELTKTVWWLVAYGVGILAFGLLTAGHTGFALAALVLVLVYAVCETLMASFGFLARGSGSGIVHRLDGFSTPLFFGVQGVIYGLSWRSPYLGLLGRDLGQVAIVASIVIVIGVYSVVVLRTSGESCTRFALELRF